MDTVRIWLSQRWVLGSRVALEFVRHDKQGDVTQKIMVREKIWEKKWKVRGEEGHVFFLFTQWHLCYSGYDDRENSSFVVHFIFILIILCAFFKLKSEKTFPPVKVQMISSNRQLFMLEDITMQWFSFKEAFSHFVPVKTDWLTDWVTILMTVWEDDWVKGLNDVINKWKGKVFSQIFAFCSWTN